MTTVDARGKLCPVPLVMTKKAYDALGAGDTMTTLVDNPTSAKNVQTFILEAGGQVASATEGTLVTLTITKGRGKSSDNPEAYCSTGIDAPHVLYVAKDSIGNGEPRELGEALLLAFLKTVKDVQPLPSHALFVHNGVKLLKNGTKTLEAVKEMEALGVSVLVCGTCLDYFGLMDGIGCGKVSNMFDILTRLSESGKVVSP